MVVANPSNGLLVEVKRSEYADLAATLERTNVKTTCARSVTETNYVSTVEYLSKLT